MGRPSRAFQFGVELRLAAKKRSESINEYDKLANRGSPDAAIWHRDSPQHAGTRQVCEVALRLRRRRAEGFDVCHGDQRRQRGAEIEDLCDARRAHAGGAIGHGREHVVEDILNRVLDARKRALVQGQPDRGAGDIDTRCTHRAG